MKTITLQIKGEDTSRGYQNVTNVKYENGTVIITSNQEDIPIEQSTIVNFNIS